MRLVLARGPLRNILRWLQRGLFVSAAALLSYCAFSLWSEWRYQKTEGKQLDRLRAEGQVAPVSHKVEAGALIGKIAVPRLGLSVVIVEGTDKNMLRRGAGHIPGTAMPGQPGNAAVSAHRDTFFRPLRNIRLRDVVTVATPAGEFRYRVVSTRIVAPTDISVLAAGTGEVLTLVTCYPFYYVGPAPKRFIVRAERTL
jgi:sortase A